MFSLEELYTVLDDYAPFRLSEELIRLGEYDNSGIIIKSQGSVNSVLFSLDLTEKAVAAAKKFSCDTIVTHHPAIYHPIKSLKEDDKTTSALLKAARYGLNVISCHLNLDVAKNGVDACLAQGLGAKTFKIIDKLEDDCGYGREFDLNIAFADLKKRIKAEFKTDKILCYAQDRAVKKCACFCGAGSSFALDFIKNGKTDADLIVTSDMPHHVIKELTEYDKSIIILPHYVAEEYGFRKFYDAITEFAPQIKTHYFYDKRFV